jgi:membrane protease YdiL (CAAX protease family)
MVWLAVFTVVASMTTLVTMTLGIARGEVLRYEGHRPAPWTWLEVVLVLAVQILLFRVAIGVDAAWYGPPGAPAPPVEAPDDELHAAHPLVVLLQKSPSPATLALAVLVAVVIAPVSEEFLFRLLILGWLERVERWLRRRSPGLRKLARGAGPLVLTSLLFAAPHYRPEPTAAGPADLIRVFALNAVVSLATVAAGIAILRGLRGASWRDLGVVPGELWSDVCLGLQSFLALVAPIYLLQLLLRLVLGADPIVDPISLFFFAMALGLLYLRTHRIVPSIVLHMALNATSLAMAWAIAPK